MSPETIKVGATCTSTVRRMCIPWPRLERGTGYIYIIYIYIYMTVEYNYMLIYIYMYLIIIITLPYM